jgi:hypothetical protein
LRGSDRHAACHTHPQITNHYDEALLPCFADVLPGMQRLASLNLSNFDLVNGLLVSVS